MDFVSLLESRWGTLEKTGHCLNNGKMPFVSDAARLNMIFQSSNASKLLSDIHGFCNSDLPDQLISFYELYNGCRLFFGSLNIFGRQIYTEEIYQPFDLIVENNHILGSLNGKEKKDCHLLFFASIGGEYAFGFDKEVPEKIVGIKKGSLKAVQEFKDFESFFDFHFNRLLNEYDDNCRKKHPLKKYQGIPVLENVSTELE